MDQQNPTLAKIPILDKRKFEQWQFRIQQCLQHEHYALWEVIEFGDSYEVPTSAASTATTDTASDGTGKKKGRTVTVTTKGMQKRKNDYKIGQELWAAILKPFGGNEATNKTKKNLLKQQYGNFKAEGSKTLEHTFNRLQVIVSQLQFMDIEIEQDDLNQKFLTSLAPEWLMHMIVWRNKSDLDTMSLDDLYNHLKVYESEVEKKSEPNPQNMAFISSANHSRGNEDVNTASVSTASTNECRAPKSQDKGRRDNYRQGSKVEEQALKALMAINGVGWEWSTKDAASQEVKKDVSFLRYIALPNWAHDALLESSSMETHIPTVSSLVPTTCFTDSTEPSSDTRLISKRVANQVETLSLDTILTLTNWFEDILRVTTNSVDSDGVEADVSNMETSIIASPTPTLRIYKDHPKSQIINPVDTPIQTSFKSKEVPKNKKDERGIVIRNKARLVAQGHTQEEGIDYDEVFVPVTRIDAIRLFLAYASFIGFIVYQMDVKSAFLYGTINEEVEFEALMHEKFQMRAMGELNFFLGLQVIQKEDGIFLS
nr:copia protein [Tanacetum cinerariifolium]